MQGQVAEGKDIALWTSMTFPEGERERCRGGTTAVPKKVVRLE